MTNSELPAEPIASEPASVKPAKVKSPKKVRTPSRHPRARRIGILVGVVALLMLAAASGGAAGGWIIANNTLVAAQANPQATVLKVPAYIGAGSVSMPDVRGLTVDDAMQVLGDAGVPANIVATSSRPAAGAKGTIIGQTPTFGTESPAKVALVVSAGGTMPAVVGQDVAAATTTLNELGVRIVRVGGYDPDSPVGSVLKSTPAKGAALAASVQLTVNEAPSARYLSTLSTLSGGCSTDSALTMNGATYAQGLDCSAGSTQSPNETSWLLEKDVDLITGQIGIPDTQDPGTTAHVEISADGKVLLSKTLTYGATVPVKVRTTGKLRLTISITTGQDESAEVGLGDLQLSGSSTAMSKLPTN